MIQPAVASGETALFLPPAPPQSFSKNRPHTLKNAASKACNRAVRTVSRRRLVKQTMDALAIRSNVLCRGGTMRAVHGSRVFHGDVK